MCHDSPVQDEFYEGVLFLAQLQSHITIANRHDYAQVTIEARA